MSSNRQLLVALGLAAAVLAIGFRESTTPGREPALLAQARLRQRSPVRPAGEGLERDGADRDAIEGSSRPEGIEEQLSGLPLVQVLALLSGGTGSSAGPTSAGEADPVTGPDQDWELLGKADSLLRSPEIRRMAERLVAQGVGGN